MFKTFGRLNVKQGHWDLRVWYDLTQYIIQGHESILVGEIEGGAFKLVYHVCVNTNEVCRWDDVGKWVKKEMRWGREGRKEEWSTKLWVQGHLYQNEPRASKTFHKHKQINFNPSRYQLTSSQRCQTLFVIVTAHKQVCANQQSHQVSFHFSCLIISSVSGKRRTFFSKLGYGLDFWLVALSAKDVGSVSQWTGFSTLAFECNSCLRPLVVWMWNKVTETWGYGMIWPVVGPYPSKWTVRTSSPGLKF